MHVELKDHSLLNKKADDRKSRKCFILNTFYKRNPVSVCNHYSENALMPEREWTKCELSPLSSSRSHETWQFCEGKQIQYFETSFLSLPCYEVLEIMMDTLKRKDDMKWLDEVEERPKEPFLPPPCLNNDHWRSRTGIIKTGKRRRSRIWTGSLE